jgi:hypothetical protein
MRKYYLLISGLLLCFQTTFGQCEIPDGDFENWIDITDSLQKELDLILTTSIETPGGWFPLSTLVSIALSDFIIPYLEEDTLDLPIISGIQRYTPGANNTATALRIGGDTLLHFADLIKIAPCGSRPEALTGFYKYMGNSFDSLSILTIFHSSDLLDTAEAIGAAIFHAVGGQPFFTPFSVPVEYRTGAVPDSMSIIIISANENGGIGIPQRAADEGYFVLDEIGFDQEYTPVLEVGDDPDLILAPNPASDFLELRAGNPFHRVDIIDYVGRVVWSQKTNDTQLLVPLHGLPAGAYFLRAFGDQKVGVRRFVKR